MKRDQDDPRVVLHSPTLPFVTPWGVYSLHTALMSAMSSPIAQSSVILPPASAPELAPSSLPSLSRWHASFRLYSATSPPISHACCPAMLRGDALHVFTFLKLVFSVTQHNGYCAVQYTTRGLREDIFDRAAAKESTHPRRESNSAWHFCHAAFPNTAPQRVRIFSR